MLETAAMQTPQALLLRWYGKNARDLPWRKTRDPYRILVSEIMLQQTQVDRVIDFYNRFLEAFPTEEKLAAAKLEKAHRLWKGLGYPSRVERLRETCRQVVKERGGEWPNTPEGLQELPGIGPYTAAAVSCFAFNKAVPLVDTNVARVYARREAMDLPIDKKAIWQFAEEQVHKKQQIRYNNALMELGALICTARQPDCEKCPWQKTCKTKSNTEYLEQSAAPLKVATKKQQYGVKITDKKKLRQHIVLALIHHDGAYLVARRKKGTHQGGKWELPGGKRERGESDRVALAREIEEELGAELLSARPFVEFTYDYGDRYLTFHCYRCHLFDSTKVKALASSKIKWVQPEEFDLLEFPPANKPIQDRFRRYHKLK